MAIEKILNQPAEEYHGGNAISFSRLKVFSQNAALYERTYISRKIERKDTQAMRDGRAIHALILEGREVFDRQFAGFTMKGSKAKNPVKAAWDLFKAQCEADGREILDDPEMVEAVYAAVMAHPEAGPLFTGGESEVTFRVDVPWIRVPVQCRLDKWHPAGHALTGSRPLVVDLKTVDSLNEADFTNARKAFEKMLYWRQPGFYQPILFEHGIEWPQWLFVFAEKKEPFGVLCLRPSERSIRLGMTANEADLKRLAECYKTGIFPNQPTGIGEIDLPAWFDGETE